MEGTESSRNLFQIHRILRNKPATLFACPSTSSRLHSSTFRSDPLSMVLIRCTSSVTATASGLPGLGTVYNRPFSADSFQIFFASYIANSEFPLRIFNVNFHSIFSLRILITTSTIAQWIKKPFSPPKLVFNPKIALSSQPIFCKPAKGTIEAGQRSPVTIVFNPDRPGCRYEAQLLVEVRRFLGVCCLFFGICVSFCWLCFSQFASSLMGMSLRSLDPLQAKAP